MNFQTIGRITKPFGVKGELKAVFYIDSVDDLDAFSAIYIKDKKVISGYSRLDIEQIKLTENRTTIKINGCDDRNLAETYRDLELFVDEEEFPKLDEGQFYLKDLVGLEVCEGDKTWGKVVNVMEIANQFMFVVRLADGKDLVVPFHEGYVSEIKGDEHKIIARDIEQLL